jgi:hypothetical protein
VRYVGLEASLRGHWNGHWSHWNGYGKAEPTIVGKFDFTAKAGNLMIPRMQPREIESTTALSTHDVSIVVRVVGGVSFAPASLASPCIIPFPDIL